MSYISRVLAAEISSISKYYDRLVQWRPAKHDRLNLYENVESPNKEVINDFEILSERLDKLDERVAVLLNATLDYSQDIQTLLSTFYNCLKRGSLLILVVYNPYYKWLYQLANVLGLRKGDLPTSFITRTSLYQVSRLAGFEIVKVRTSGYLPFSLFGLGDFINNVLPCIPLARWLAFANILVLRPIISSANKPSLSVIVPARNEKGNIERVVSELDKIEAIDFEVIFVEGHSNDGTWDEIVRVASLEREHFKIKYFRQTGIGKVDAVRLGFAQAQNELLTILDVDLTVSPEYLQRFYDAYCKGFGDFINGNRLIYPMETGAMPFINKLGNIFFAKALSLTLGVSLADTLCGTKLFSRNDYHRFCLWLRDFGDFDPFGDFELLFPAAILGLGIVDIPISYKQRTYGTTNIRRFRDGLRLLRMTLIGFWKITLGRTPNS